MPNTLQPENERFQGHLIRLGTLALVLGIVPAAMGGFELAVTPEYAIATHVAMLMYGVLLLCLGLSWNQLDTGGLEHAAFWALVAGGLLLFVTGTFAAMKGVGGDTLSAFNADAIGTRVTERAVWFGAALAGISLFAGLALITRRVWLAADGSLAATQAAALEAESQPTATGPSGSDASDTDEAGPNERESLGFVASLRQKIEATPVETQLFRWGFVLMAMGVASATVHGLFGLRWLSVAAHATIGITALTFMAMGHVWKRLLDNLEGRVKEADPSEKGKERENKTRIPKIVLWTLGIGAALNVLAGMLAALWHLHDPLAVVSAGWTSDLAQVLSSANRVASFRVKTVALLALFANSIGIVVFAHGIYDRAGRRSHTTMDKVLSDRLVRFGTLALVVGFLTAWLPELSRLPRVAVGTYATLLIIGPMFICFGLVWDWNVKRGVRVRLSYRKQRFVVTALSLGALGIVVAGMVLALLGIGGNTLTVSARGALGSDRVELLAKIFVDTAIFTVGTAMIMFWIGLRPPSRTSFHRVAWAASIGTVAVVLQMTFYHAVVNTRLAGSYPIRLPDYGYGENVNDWSVDQMWDDPGDQNGGGTAQHWTRDDWQWFYHASQGGAFEVPIPYEWLMALEQPTVPVWPRWGVEPLMDPEYLQRFGFLPNRETQYDPDRLSINQGYVASFLTGVALPDNREPVENNARQLPVGFARTDNWVDQSTGEMVDVMGFTCAACHTSELDYRNEAGNILRLRVEGGPANVDLGKFRRAVAVSLGLTRLLPGRFERFADKLGIEGRQERRHLEEGLDRLIDRVAAVKTLQDSLEIYPTEEGFGRLDAMGRIFNFVFGTDLDDAANLGVANAPVNFPYLWDAPRFEWVQYNASFRQPMVRNAGQSMGVFASVDLHGAGEPVSIEDDPELFTASINVLNIHEMELLIGGCTLQDRNRPGNLKEGCPDPFEGLTSPRWPDVFPPIDSAAAEVGRGLYLERCAQCHLPPPDSLARDPDAWTTQDGNSFLSLHVILLAVIGTDPWAARNFATRQVRLGELGERLEMGPDSMPAAEALLPVVDSVLARRYRAYGVDESLEPILNGHRESEQQVKLGYRARPLNGVWATAPFLHNGSVPTLYQLLSPQSERPDTFHLGSRMFDPNAVGFDYRKHDAGFFEFDTSLPGNSNLGHSFEGTEDGWRGRAGVIGPGFTPAQRYRIIEYLKTLPALPVRPDAEAGGGG